MFKAPVIYEINTPVFLHELGVKEGREVTLASVPDTVWDEIAAKPFDMVWFMGIWQRSQIAREMALSEPWLKRDLPDVESENIVGSAYSIQRYEVDNAYGGNEALAIARQKLQERGLKIMLDYVPNHVGIDHHWVSEHPDYFLSGTEEELAKNPGAFAHTTSGIFAKGKDPNFEPWSDVLQLNAFSGGLRQAVAETLGMIANMADAVRCDMAMLMMNDIFKKTWGDRAGAVPDTQYWPAIIQSAKTVHPEFIFLAEVYWGKEKDLIAEGFDFCYDKELYDYLLENSARAIHRHLHKVADMQDHLMRFIENHDEKRIAAEVPIEKHRAAAAVLATLPGARLYHQGQFEGRKIKLPVHVRYYPHEEPQQETLSLYDALFGFLKQSHLYEGEWQLIPVHSGLFSRHAHSLLAWSWRTSEKEYVICINYSPEHSSGSLPYLKAKPVGRVYDLYFGDTTAAVKGVKVSLSSWQTVVIEV